MNTISIVLVDSLRILRQALTVLLETEPDLKVVGEAADGLEGVVTVERLQPDVLVLDLALPGLNGLDVILQVSHRAPRVGVLVLTARDNEALVLQALKNGALGYVLKDSTLQILSQAVRIVATGGRYLYPPITERAIDVYLKQADGRPSDLYDTLSFREREVLQLAAEGATSAEIANRLSISRRTFEAHRLRAMHKLDLRTRTDLICYAIRRGILLRDE